MDWKNPRILRLTLRSLGLFLLAAAYGLGRILVAISAPVPAQQPPLVYLLSLLAFALASAGAALFLEGHHLFDRVRISERWSSRAPPALTESRWASDDPPRPADRLSPGTGAPPHPFQWRTDHPGKAMRDGQRADDRNPPYARP